MPNTSLFTTIPSDSQPSLPRALLLRADIDMPLARRVPLGLLGTAHGAPMVELEVNVEEMAANAVDRHRYGTLVVGRERACVLACSRA